MIINQNIFVQKVIDTLKIGGRSDKTISNYVAAINRFLSFFINENVSSFDESKILEYLKVRYLQNKCSTYTYNLNIATIKFFYAINFNKYFNDKLLPHSRITKRIPTTLSKELFSHIFYAEKSIEHKCWLLLAYSSGLRVSEVASVKIEDIDSTNHRIKVLGKRKKER